jgi:predicted RNase H-like nuclease (RuvC/YqgF family)
MTVESSIIVAIIGAIVAIIGARWQSKTTTKATLATAEAEFRDDLLTEIKSLRDDIDTIIARNAALVNENARLSAEVVTLQSKVERLIQDLTARQLERDILKRQVENQQLEIIQLRRQVDALEAELHLERSRTRNG